MVGTRPGAIHNPFDWSTFVCYIYKWIETSYMQVLVLCWTAIVSAEAIIELDCHHESKEFQQCNGLN
jgi:hypothetical protein